jgi:tetratricopeptide (TPR) repeat protein
MIRLIHRSIRVVDGSFYWIYREDGRPMGRFRTLRFTSVLIAFIALGGCSLNRLAIRSTGEILEGSLEALYSESDLDLAETATKAELKMLEGLIIKDPGNRKLLTLAARGFASYAMGFVEDDSPDRAREFYRRGMEYGFSALEPALSLQTARISSFPEFEQAVAKIGADRQEELFWTTFAWGGMVSLSLSDPQALADLPRVQAMMERALVLDENYYYGGPHLFLGTFHASRPPLLGGDPETARKYFEKALDIGKRRFLMALVYYARTYAVTVQDRDLFERLLKEVTAASLEAIPEERLSNTLAVKKAELYLKDIDEYF